MHSHTPSPGRPVDHARRRSPFPHVRLAVAALVNAIDEREALTR